MLAQENVTTPKDTSAYTPLKIVSTLSPDPLINWNKVLNELEKSSNKEKFFMNLIEKRFILENDTAEPCKMTLVGKDISKTLPVSSNYCIFDQRPYGTYTITATMSGLSSFWDSDLHIAIDTAMISAHLAGEYSGVELTPSIYWINLHGKVVGHTGQPIGGALVEAIEVSRYLNRCEKEPDVWTAITNHNGCCTIPHLPPDDIFEIGRLLLLDKPAYNNAVKIYIATDSFPIEPRLIPLISENLLKGGR